MAQVGKSCAYLTLEGEGLLTRNAAIITYVHTNGSTCDLDVFPRGDPQGNVPSIMVVREVAYCENGDEPGMWTEA